jgi:hypothetical protein
MIRTRSSLKSSKHFNNLIKKNLKEEKAEKYHRYYIKHLKKTDLSKSWPLNRNLKRYDKFFSYSLQKLRLGNNIFDFLERSYLKKKRKVNVLDLGYGEGFFLSDLKRKLSDKKIPSNLEGLSLVDNSSINTKRNINKITNKPATEQVLSKKYDLIVSLNSAINFELTFLKKNLILKYAYALKKGGILLVNGINTAPRSKELIVKHLKKQGFNAFFCDKNTFVYNKNKKSILVIVKA